MPKVPASEQQPYGRLLFPFYQHLDRHAQMSCGYLKAKLIESLQACSQRFDDLIDAFVAAVGPSLLRAIHHGMHGLRRPKFAPNNDLLNVNPSKTFSP